MLIKKMDISQLITYADQIKGEKLKEKRIRESKRTQFNNGFSNARSSGGNGYPQ